MLAAPGGNEIAQRQRARQCGAQIARKAWVVHGTRWQNVPVPGGA
jgi:hypothetical protein